MIEIPVGSACGAVGAVEGRRSSCARDTWPTVGCAATPSEGECECLMLWVLANGGDGRSIGAGLGSGANALIPRLEGGL